MFRYLFNRKIFEQKICAGQYHLPRFLTIRIILSILFLLFLFFILRIWGNRINFGRHSYVFGRETILEIRSSRFHNITVAQSGSLRMLRFEMLNIQGVMHIENPYTIIFDYMHLQLLCLLWNPEPERILIIGLGIGILPKIFNYLSSNTLIDIVEIDSKIVDLARKYFEFNENNFIRVFVNDGRDFIERQRSNQYDVIIIDAFTVNHRVPHGLRTLECLGEYLRILKPSGLVLANFVYEQESRYRQTYARALFKHIYQVITKNNYILIGLNENAKVFDQNLLKLRAQALQQDKPVPDMNWIEKIKYIHNGSDYKWNISATIFTDTVYEDFLGLSERN